MSFQVNSAQVSVGVRVNWMMVRKFCVHKSEMLIEIESEIKRKVDEKFLLKCE
jgi:hypothetical protein